MFLVFSFCRKWRNSGNKNNLVASLERMYHSFVFLLFLGIISVLSHSALQDPCPARFYCPGGGAKRPCPIGAFCPQGAGRYTICPAGQFTNVTEQEKCSPCPAGSFCVPENVDVGIVATVATVCRRGFYCPQVKKSRRVELVASCRNWLPSSST